MEIAIIIRPSATLTPEQFQRIHDKAAELKISADQLVVDAILTKLGKPVEGNPETPIAA